MIDFVGARAVPLPIREELDFRSTSTTGVSDHAANEVPDLSTAPPTRPVACLPVRIWRPSLRWRCSTIFVVADEIYSEIIYDGDHHSIATFPGMPERTAMVDGFSKT